MLHAEQIDQISTSSFKLLCLNDLSCIDHQSTPNTFVYAGYAAPKLDECNLHWNSRSLKDGCKLRFAIANAGMFPLNPPVSCSLSSLALQTRQLSNYDIRIFKRALGRKGSFPLRKNCDGHNSYISSLRKGNTRASTFPNAGPSTQSQLSFLRQRHNDFDGMFVVPKLQDSME